MDIDYVVRGDKGWIFWEGKWRLKVKIWSDRILTDFIKVRRI
jgi:hypothetical protein